MSGENLEYKIVFSPSARKQIILLDKSVQSRIRTALTKLCRIPPEGDIVKLKGRPGQFRLRVGDWRIIYRQEKNSGVI